MERMVGETAAAIGYVLRVLVWVLSQLPAIAGPLLVLWGTWAIYPPAAYILAGAAICLVTYGRPNRRRR
jgi:hypothetical protein